MTKSEIVRKMNEHDAARARNADAIISAIRGFIECRFESYAAATAEIRRLLAVYDAETDAHNKWLGEHGRDIANVALEDGAAAEAEEVAS